MSTASGAVLVGRAEELARLRECCRSIAGNGGTLVLVDGDAGTGKTRLLAEATKAGALPRGYASVSVGALDYARAPYAPIRDLLLVLDKRFPKVLATESALAAELKPVLDFARPGLAAGEGDQRRILDAVVAALAKFASAAPLVAAIEDVHWLDRASADVLLHLSRRIREIRALLLVSFRPSEIAQEPDAQHLLAQLTRSAGLSLSLRPLEASDAMLLIDAAAPRDLPMNVRRHICKIAGGNPLLLLELTKLAVEYPEKLQGALPVTLKALVSERLAGFDPLDVDVLRVAAEMGEFGPDLLAEIAGVESERVMTTLRKACKASIIAERARPNAPFVFRHALIRQAITDDVLLIDRSNLHRRIASRLELLPDTAELHARLAHHFYHAGDREKSRRYNDLAADEAMNVFAFGDAVTLCERAIDGREIDAGTFLLHRRLANAQIGVHRQVEAAALMQRLFEFAVREGDTPAAADLGFELSRCRHQLLDEEAALETVRRAIAVVDAQRFPQQAFNLRATLAWFLTYLRRTDEGGRALADANALISYGDAGARVRFYEASATFKVHSGTGAATYRDDLEEALRIARSQSPLLYVQRLENAMALSQASTIDDMDFALDLCERFREIVPSHPEHVIATAGARVAWPLYLAGDLHGAYDLLSRSFAAAEELPIVSFNVARVAVPLAVHLDDAVLLQRAARPRLLQSAFASNTPNVFGPVAAAIAQQLRAQHRASEAATLVTQAIKRIPFADNNLPLLIEAARLGASEALERGFDLLDEFKEVSRSGRAAWHLCTAYVSTGEIRRAHAQQAADVFHDIHWNIYRAEALELSGQADAALEAYRRMGSVSGIRRLESARAVKSRTGLSPREWEVAHLVGQGKSNRTIAEDLVLSERTIENHIASIFAKLSVRSRSEVAAFVARSASAEGEI